MARDLRLKEQGGHAIKGPRGEEPSAHTVKWRRLHGITDKERTKEDKGISKADPQTTRIHLDRAVQTVEAIRCCPVSVCGAVRTYFLPQTEDEHGDGGFAGIRTTPTTASDHPCPPKPPPPSPARVPALRQLPAFMPLQSGRGFSLPSQWKWRASCPHSCHCRADAASHCLRNGSGAPAKGAAPLHAR